MLRNPTLDEIRLLSFLISKAEDFAVPKDWPEKLMVAEMNDEGMGSLQLFPAGIKAEKRRFGRQVSECQFTDEDGVEVIACINLDQFDNLYELDVWKTNFTRLIRIPKDPKELRRVDE